MTALRFFADTFFAKRYGNRAIVLETVAAVPGMVGGMLVHLRCLRWMVTDHGWIHTLLEEADNERMHLMTFVEIAKPSWFERMVILVVQALFFVLPANATLRDVVLAVRADEVGHRDVNHQFANALNLATLEQEA
jgi:hypothetical protein